MLFLACVEHSWASCVVDSFTVKDDFEPQRIFMDLTVLLEMMAPWLPPPGAESLSLGSGLCVPTWLLSNPGTPSKMFMNYQVLASYLSSGGDNYWVIDTDYDNYAITYACRSQKEDGSCEDGYSLVFSRNPRGLPPTVQRVVRQKQEKICMAGEFQAVLQSGAC